MVLGTPPRPFALAASYRLPTLLSGLWGWAGLRCSWSTPIRFPSRLICTPCTPSPICLSRAWSLPPSPISCSLPVTYKQHGHDTKPWATLDFIHHKISHFCSHLLLVAPSDYKVSKQPSGFSASRTVSRPRLFFFFFCPESTHLRRRIPSVLRWSLCPELLSPSEPISDPSAGAPPLPPPQKL